MATGKLDVWNELTPRQTDVMKYIIECYRQGWMPTVRDIMEEIGVTSPNGAMNHIHALRRKGWLESPGQKACVRLTEKSLNEAWYSE